MLTDPKVHIRRVECFCINRLSYFTTRNQLITDYFDTLIASLWMAFIRAELTFSKKKKKI